ncbi:TatD family hydrolase [Halothermothrix orenii]|uniref:Hydrolase, TatD family n=1 Tax=Halothermothrix orenii (strain H 168 / OCM 544 / DSM 9562) TaxID=373903 RepID=B8D0K2_HALOH|nr:TatD family hydrolase [Halothermothrix orenii]ACL70938.1 hydrolase, TatD family [Halothermothrix orenii H 168]
MQLIDTHAHLDFPRFKKDRVKVIKRAEEDGVKYIINVGADLASSHRSLRLSQEYDHIFATVGIHPHDADQVDGRALKVLKDLAKADKVVAIGEIGLDYYYDNSPRDVQKEAFKRQLELAHKLKLPVVIHSREADEDTLEILKEMEVGELGGVMHCFAGHLEMARECLSLNMYLAFGGVITFKNADKTREVVREIPLDRILIETDSPYLTPHPYRGKRNEPSYVRFVAEKIAELKDKSMEEITRITTANAINAFNLSL